MLNEAKLNILRCGNCENQMSSLQDLVKHYTREHKKVEKMAEPLMTCYVCKLNVGIYDFGNHFSKHTKAYLLSVAAMRAERKKGFEVNYLIEKEAPLDLPSVYQLPVTVPSRMGNVSEEVDHESEEDEPEVASTVEPPAPPSQPMNPIWTVSDRPV